MSVPPIRIANFSGYLGDRYTALDEVMRGDPVDVLMGDYLAEITLAALAALGSVLALVGAVTIARAAGSTRGLSTRYDAPAVRRERAGNATAAGERSGSPGDTGDVSERALWDALDAGRDPTAPDATGPDHT